MRLSLSRFLLRSTGFMGVFLAMGIAVASAAPILVDTLNDVEDTAADCSAMVIGDLPGTDGKVSLREAICVANNDGVGSVIAFTVSGQISFSDPAGTPQIENDGTLLIDGDDNIELDGQSGSAGCFGTDLESSSVAGVTIQELTFQNFADASLCVSGSGWVVKDNHFLATTSDVGAAMHVYGSGHMIRDNNVGLMPDTMTKSAMYDGIVLHNNSTSTVVRDNYITSGGGCGIKFWNQMGSTTIIGNKIGVNIAGASTGSAVGICDNVGGTYSGLVTIGGDEIVERNVISGMTGNGIDLRGPYTGGMLIQGNYIGTVIDGSAPRPNARGMLIKAACTVGSQCMIGGNVPGTKNVISGNAGAGIRFGNGANYWIVKNNSIGLNAAGNASIANSTDGIYVTGNATNLTIGDPAHRNIISGNTERGIRVLDATGMMTISGNNIGTNPAGTAAIPNGLAAVGVQGLNPAVTVGQVDASAPTNIFSGNIGRGIRIQNTLGGLVKVYSSIIGLNADQSAALGNGKQALMIDGTSNAATITIGNTRTAGFNVMAGNSTNAEIKNGIKIEDGSSAIISGNFIGTNNAGTLVPGNGGESHDGVFIAGDNVLIRGNVLAGSYGQIDDSDVGLVSIRSLAANTLLKGNFFGMLPDGTALGTNNVGVIDQGSGTIIGTAAVEDRNFFGNLTIAISAKGSTGTTVVNNYIGVRPDGAPVPSIGHGIILSSNATGVTIGGATVETRNVISNITNNGVLIDSATNSVILGNFIGTNSTGDAAMANGVDGIRIVNATNFYIGRDISGANHNPNVISGNTGGGIYLLNTGTITTGYIEANKIGTNVAGTAAIANGIDGIKVAGGAGIVIGGADAPSRNLISGNTDNGVVLDAVNGIAVMGNYIGTNLTNTEGIPNKGSGVLLVNGANTNVVGFPYSAILDASRRNIINYNTEYGIKLNGVTTAGNVMRGNFIGPNNGLGDFSFTNQANDSVSLQNTGLSTYSNALVDGATNLRGKIDLYALRSNNTITYEGTANIQNDGNFVLFKPFTTTQNDRYFVQITTAAGNSTGTNVYRYVTVNNNEPFRPLITSPITARKVAPYTMEGTKQPYKSIWINGSEAVPADEENTWSYGLTLTEGANEFTVVAKDEAGTASPPRIVNIILDTVAPSIFTVRGPTIVTGTGSTVNYQVRGTKEAGTSVWLGGGVIIPLNANGEWVYSLPLVEDMNSFTFVSKDAAGNASSDVAWNVAYVVVPSYGGGGGGGGGPSGPAPSAPAFIQGPAPAVQGPGPNIPAPNAPGPNVPATNDPGPNVPAQAPTVPSPPPGPQVTAHVPSNPPPVKPPPVKSPPATQQQVVQNAQNNYPVYQPNTPPAVKPPPPPPSGEVKPDALGTPAPTPNKPPRTLHQAAEQAPQQFQNIFNIVEISAPTQNENQVATDAPATTVSPGTPAPNQTIQVRNIVNVDNIFIPNGFVKQNGVVMPAATAKRLVQQQQAQATGQDVGQQTSAPAAPRKPIPGNPPAVAPPPPDRLQMLLSPVYAEITPTNDLGIPVHLEHKFQGDLSADSDGDGLTNAQELAAGTDPTNADADGDGISDGAEVASGMSPFGNDSDFDGVSDGDEIANGTDPLSGDSDGDGVPDGLENRLGTDATDANDAPGDADGNGFVDAAEKEFNVGQDKVITVSAGVEIKIKATMVDSDNDGVTDIQEIKIGTNPHERDSDGDGIPDGAEINILKTNPTEKTSEKEAFRPRPALPTYNPVFTHNKPSVPGVAPPLSKVEVLFIPRTQIEDIQAEESALSNLSKYLMANLFTETEEGYYKVDTIADAGGKFLASVDHLPDNEYDVLVRVFDANGDLTEEGLPMPMTVDSSKATAAGVVLPEQLDSEFIDVSQLKLITLENSRPILYGTATKDYEVQVMWASELFSSSLMIDTDKDNGEFVVMAPSELEEGEHEVMVQGIDPFDNLYTSAINVDFMVMASSIQELTENDPAVRTKILLVGFGGVGLIVIFWLIAHTKRKQYID
jgi:hypothetical protein